MSKAQSAVTGFGSAATVAMAGAGIAVAAFGVASVKAAMETQQVMAQTEAVLKSTGGAANVTAEQVTGLADSLRDMSGVDDEAVQASENLLLTFTAVRNEAGKGNDIFNQTERAIVDMATAMNSGAIPTMEDLHNTTIQVGKALNDPITGMTALRRVGVRFTEDQAKVIAKLQESGDLMGAQKLILQELSTEFGGAAKAAGDTFAGQLAKLQSKFGDVAEEFGTALLPALEGLVTILQDYAIPLLAEFVRLVEIAASPDTYTSIPIVGDAFHILGVGIQAVKDALDTSDASVRQNSATFQDQSAILSETEKECKAYAAALKGLEGGAKSAGTEFTRLSKAGKEVAQGLREELPNIIGTVTTWKETFSLTPAKMREIAETWVRIGKTIAKDLRELAESDLAPAMKEAIAALPPEMRHAWAEGNAKQKAAIQKSLRDTFDIQETLNSIANNAAGAARSVGQSIASGIALGITTSSELITIAAANAVHRAIQAAKDAADIHSPSKKMFKLGQDLMEGLKDGIGDKDREVAQKLTDSIGKMLDAAKSALGDFRSKMQDFAGRISGGFSSFSDLVGGFGQGEEPLGIQDFLASQLAGAQGFADVLDALKRQGASKGLLSQIGAAGPEGLGFAQALLQGGPELVETASKTLSGINKIADHEGGVLSKDFFGNKMDKLQNRADRIGELLAEANRLQSGKGGDITLMLDGNVLAKVTRDQLLKLGNRNAGTGIR